MKIPFLDLAAQYRRLQPGIEQALRRVLDSGRFILGAEVEAFEREFAAYCGTEHAVGLASGTDALHLALRAAGLQPGDEVITSAHTAVAGVAAIELAGGRPVLADIAPGFFTLDAQKVQAALTPRTRFLLPVHLYGCPADLPALLALARSHGLTVVEDCAQAHGARSGGRRVGSLGELGAFSFYPTKNLGAYGDGGAVVTNDAGLAGELRSLRQYGWDEQRVSRRKGFNSRLDEVQAAILRVKLADLDSSNARRRELAELYASQLAGSGVALPAVPAEAEAVHHLFVIRHPRRDELQRYLAERGIGSAIHYPVPIHRMPAYRDLGVAEGDLPETERACREVLSLPFYPEMSAAMVESVCRAVRDFLAGRPER